MKYGEMHTASGVSVHRDVYAEQFAEPGDLKYNYWVEIHGDCIAESESREHLATQLRRICKRLQGIANSLDHHSRTKPMSKPNQQKRVQK